MENRHLLQINPPEGIFKHAGIMQISWDCDRYFPPGTPTTHFHAVYGEYQITVDILTGVVHGSFPKRALRLVLEWMELHERELMQNWDAVQSGGSVNKISPSE